MCIGFGEAINEKEVKMLKMHRTHFRKHIGPGPNDAVFSKSLAAKDIEQLFELSDRYGPVRDRNERCRHRKVLQQCYDLSKTYVIMQNVMVLSEAGPRSPQAAFRSGD